MAHSSDLGAGDVKLLKDQYNLLRKDVLDTSTGHKHTGAAGDGTKVTDAYVCVRDKKAQNTHGGTFTSGAWQTRDVNEEQADPRSICSVASNQITLVAGTYRCHISAPAYNVDSHQTRLRNITDGTTLLVGTAERETVDVGRSFIVGRFTLAATKVLEVQHQCSVTQADTGFGYRCNFTDEIYTIAEFWREVD